MNGAQILVKTLASYGVQRVSTVAGESYLSVLDALLDYPDIQVVTCRQEGGAAFMAESWGKLTHTPGICFVTRGPGACNASIGIHTAMQDSTPMILFMGQVRREEKGREAFQEIDVAKVFGTMAKWATEITDASQIPEVMQKAFSTALSGRPGPVVIGLPEDMLRDPVKIDHAPAFMAIRRTMGKSDIDAIARYLKKAKRPIVLAGGSGWNDEACASLMRFAEKNNLPVTAAFRRQDLCDHRHPCYVGELGTGPNPTLVEQFKTSDLVIAIGTRLGEIVTQGYTLLDLPKPGQPLIHIHASGGEIGKVFKPALKIQADHSLAAIALADIAADSQSWSGWTKGLRATYEQWTAIDPSNQPDWNGANMTAIFGYLRDTLPADAIVTTDAGNFSGWAQRYLRYGRPGRLLAPTSGAMGYGVPSAIGASLMYPDRTVLGLCGDGGFMMTGQELATAMHHGASPIIMICNNGMYGTIRMHQEKNYPGRISATALTNPDFIALAVSYGAWATRVTQTSDFPAAWSAARNAGKLAVLEIKMDSKQITTNSRA